MELVINNYPVNRVVGNYSIQAQLDEFARSEATTMVVVIPKDSRARVKGTWKQAIARSQRNYVLDTVDIGIRISRR